MGLRHTYATDLQEAGLAMPEDAMTGMVVVYGSLFAPTQPSCLRRHADGVYTHRLQWQIGLAGDAVATLVNDVVLPHLAAHGVVPRKPATYLQATQILCYSFARARADEDAFGVPVVTTFSKSRSAFTRQRCGSADSMPGFAVIDTLFTALVDLGMVVVTASRIDGQLSTIVPTDKFIPYSTDLSPLLLSRNGQGVVMTARTKVRGKKVATGRLTATGRHEMRTTTIKGGHKPIESKDLSRIDQRYVAQECLKLTIINNLLSRCNYAICDRKGVWHPYFAGNTLYHAVWNNSDTDHGGRNYCGVQNLPQRCSVPIRETLHIGLPGQPLRATVEIDYKNLHIRCLYALVGHALPDDYDCYDILIPGWARSPQQRSFLKVLLLALPNCGNPKASPAQNLKTAYAMANKQYRTWHMEPIPNDHDGYLTHIRRQERRLPEGVTPASVVDAILAAHEPIAEYLYSGMGLELQAVDGQIARDIMLHFAQKGVPCIGIHDSFMVWHEHQAELEALMISEYLLQMEAFYPGRYDGSAPVPEFKDKKRTSLPPIPADLHVPITAKPVPRNPPALPAAASTESTGVELVPPVAHEGSVSAASMAPLAVVAADVVDVVADCGTVPAALSVATVAQTHSRAATGVRGAAVDAKQLTRGTVAEQIRALNAYFARDMESRPRDVSAVITRLCVGSSNRKQTETQPEAADG